MADSNTSAVIKSVWTLSTKEREENNIDMNNKDEKLLQPKSVFTASAPFLAAHQQQQQQQIEGYIIFDKCFLRYVVPPQWLASEWAGMYRMFSLFSFIMAIAYILATMCASMAYRNEINNISSSSEREETLLYNLLPAFNSILIFGLFAVITTFLAGMTAAFAAYHARQRFNAALIICSLTHVGLLLLSTLFLLAVVITVFVVRKQGAPISTKNALSMLISSMLIFGIPIQILFVLIALYTIYIKTKLNHYFGKQPIADLC